MLKVIKKTMKTTCWVCKGKGELMVSVCKTGAIYKPCKACHKTGKWEESIYYHIYTGKDGKQYCIDSDTIK